MALRGSLRIVKLDGHDASAASTYEVTFTLSHGAALTPHKCCGLGKLEEYLANFAIEAAYLRPAVEHAKTHGRAQILRVTLPECNWGHVEGVL